ncbi:mandelate racemase/muconate lactonizing enzyme family protein [Chloroflexota bacterium]
MKITNVKIFPVNPGIRKNWIFVKAETDEGISGWGEVYNYRDRITGIMASIDSIKRYLIGRNPYNIKNFTQIMFDDFAARRGGMEFYCAISGLEQALWDIVGKALNTPVYNLLGGPVRDKIRVYANGWFGDAKTPEEFAEKAIETVEDGFTALKFDPFSGPYRHYIDKEIEKTAVARVQAVRKAVGPDIDLLIEVHRRLSPMHAIRVGKMLEEFKPFWYEEPVPADNVDALVEVKRNVNIPIVTGETLYTKTEFRDVFVEKAVDIINPDVCNTGGILELKEIAAMAEPFLIGVAPHNFNSTTIGLAATINAAASMPNFIITEYFVNFKSRGDQISVDPFKVENSYIKLPTKPGLGLELNEEAMVKYPYREFELRHVQQYYEEI